MPAFRGFLPHYCYSRQNHRDWVFTQRQQNGFCDLFVGDNERRGSHNLVIHIALDYATENLLLSHGGVDYVWRESVAEDRAIHLREEGSG